MKKKCIYVDDKFGIDYSSDSKRDMIIVNRFSLPTDNDINIEIYKILICYYYEVLQSLYLNQ